MISITRGNILNDPADAIVVPINVEGELGQGLDFEMAKVCPDNYHWYKDLCFQGYIGIGHIAVFDILKFHFSRLEQRDRYSVNPLYILNFPTKYRVKDSAKLEYIDAGMKSLVQTVASLDIRSMAIPAFGCWAVDDVELIWSQVMECIIHYCQYIRPIDIRIYEPYDFPSGSWDSLVHDSITYSDRNILTMVCQ